jgi:hypothetical protein
VHPKNTKKSKITPEIAKITQKMPKIYIGDNRYIAWSFTYWLSPITTFHHVSDPQGASGWRIHCGVEVTELSTNKQHTLSLGSIP